MRNHRDTGYGALAGVLLGLLLVAGGKAQSLPTVTLSGHVTDAESGEGLSGAYVFSLTHNVGVFTDEEGFFRLATPLAREAVIHARYLGYEAETDTLVLDRDTKHEFMLQPAIFDLDEAVVIADREEDVVTSTQMSAVTLTAEEVKQLPSFMGEVDVLKTLQLLPGVQSGTEGSTGLYVRGGGPDQNLVLVDGAPIYNPSHVFGFLSVFNADAVDRVQLIKGGFPARFGGRLSSVVDLRMKDGNKEAYEADGTVGLVFSSFTVQGPLSKGRASFLVSARRTYIDVLARPFLNRRLAEGQKLVSYFYDANAKLSLTASPRDRLYLTLYGGRDVYGSALETVDRTRDPVQSQRNTGGADWGNATASLRWNHLFSNALFANTSLYYSGYVFDVKTSLEQIAERSPPVHQSEEITYGSGVRDLGARLDVVYKAGPLHDLRMGGQVTRHRFNPGVSSLRLRLSQAGVVDTTLTPNAFPFEGTEAFLFAEDEVALSTSLQMNLGLHASLLRVNGLTYRSLQPRLAGRYLVRPNWSLKVSVVRMKQYLHLLTNTGINMPTDLWLAATDRIGPQRSWQVAAGTQLNLGNRFVASVEAYYKDMRGLLEYQPGASFIAPNTDWQDQVAVGRGWSYGTEVFVRKKTGRTTGWVGYTLSWTERRFESLNSGAVFPYRYDRRHDISVVGSRQLGERLDIGLTWVYGTGQAITLASDRFADGRLLDFGYFTGQSNLPELRAYDARGSFRMAAYHRLDLVLNWHLRSALLGVGEGTLSLGAYNVYSRKNPFYLFTTRSPSGGLTYKQASLFPVLPFLSYRFAF